LSRLDHVGFTDHESGDEFHLDDYVSKELIESIADNLKKCVPGVTFQLLASASHDLDLPFDLDPLLPDELVAKALPHATRLIGSVWTAFGEALGVVREMDVCARLADASLPTPRAFQLMPSASDNQIEDAIAWAERNLSGIANDEVRPEQIMLCVSPAIEAVAKRIWPGDGGYYKLRVVLADKVQRTQLVTPCESRFANVALTLYKSYRNPLAHNMDQHRYSYSEARYFVAGIRCLLDLSRSIVEDRRRNPGK
jgi:hypothetical protein